MTLRYWCNTLSTELPSHMDALYMVNCEFVTYPTHVSSAVRIYDFHIFIFIYFTIIGYYHELTIDHLSMRLGSSVDRALHRYRKVMGSNPIQT